MNFDRKSKSILWPYFRRSGGMPAKCTYGSGRGDAKYPRVWTILLTVSQLRSFRTIERRASSSSARNICKKVSLLIALHAVSGNDESLSAFCLRILRCMNQNNIVVPKGRGLYALLSTPIQAQDENRPNPSTTLTASIETIDNDRAMSASTGSTGLPLP